MNGESRFPKRSNSCSTASVLCQKFAKEVGGLSIVMLAKAGIQKHSIFLDSGSRYPGL